MPRAVDGALQSAVDQLNARVQADPEIQAILQQNRQQLAATRDRGGSAREFQHRIRDQVTEIARRKGYIPREANYFVNPNDGQLEPHRGWGGLSGWQRAAIIGAAAAGAAVTGGALAGAFGGAGAGGGGAAAGTAAGTAGGTLASSSLPVATLMGGPAAITSGAASAGIGAAAGGGSLLGALGASAPEWAVSTVANPASAWSPGAVGASQGAGVSQGTGFLSTLGRVFTRGNDVLDTIGRVGGVLSGAARGSADQRMDEADRLLRMQQLQQALAGDRYAAEQRGAEFTATERERRQRNALKAAMLAGAQDAVITPGNPAIAARMPTITGGLRPSMLSQDRRDMLIQLLERPEVAPATYQPPPTVELPTQGPAERILGGIGIGASVLGAVPRRQTSRPASY